MGKEEKIKSKKENLASAFLKITEGWDNVLLCNLIEKVWKRVGYVKTSYGTLTIIKHPLFGEQNREGK